MESNSTNDEIQIDIRQLVMTIISNIWVILISGVACAVIALIISEVIIAPQYQSAAKMYIINRQNEGTTTYSDIQSSTQLVKDYKVLVTSSPVLDKVISNLDLGMSDDKLAETIQVSIETDSRVLEIVVMNKDP